MELARGAMGLPPARYRLDPALKELTFGDWEGLTWPEVKARDAKGVAARHADKWDFVPPKGESYAMLARRVAAWLGTLTADAFVVSHGGVARALMVLIGGAPAAVAADAPIVQGRALVFEEDGATGSAEGAAAPPSVRRGHWTDSARFANETGDGAEGSGCNGNCRCSWARSRRPARDHQSARSAAGLP